MRRLLMGISLGAAMAVFAQEAAEQTIEGAPAKLLTANGREANVLVREIKDGVLTFGIYKSDRIMTAPVDKILSLEFVQVDYDVAAVESNFVAAAYDEVISTLNPIMEELIPYMGISNNLQNAAFQMMQAYRGLDEWDEMVKIATVLRKSNRTELSSRSEMYLVLASLAQGDLDAVKSFMEGLEMGPAKLYLTARLQQAEGDRAGAHKTVCELIKVYGNDMEWLPAAELLSANLYAMMENGLGDKMALGTAGQVANLYAGTHISGDALRFKSELELEISQRKNEEVVVNEGESDE